VLLGPAKLYEALRDRADEQQVFPIAPHFAPQERQVITITEGSSDCLSDAKGKFVVRIVNLAHSGLLISALSLSGRLV
jgi:hypothetical protein